ncbi:hypothetical protein [Pedobacter nyackensis]|uniref:hypothetical protein n=1 Tax=Pedobacter nyackensis TaxID=475255 RepID=UPI00292CBA28|nr:hypothetical protein [Pedobacter nyackensis]
MKKIIYKVILFLMPIVVFAYCIDVFLSKNLKKTEYRENPVWRAIYDGQVNSKVVIYGSSRAWVHVNPTKIADSLNTTAYNLGIDGHNFWLQYFRHQQLLKYNTKPKLIIHTLDPMTLVKRAELYNSEQFLPYMLFNDDIYNATRSYKGFGILDYNVPLLRYYGQKDAIMRVVQTVVAPETNRKRRIRGYQGQNVVWNSDFDRAKAKMKSYKMELDQASIALFSKYLEECAKANIKVIFVYTPEYIEGQRFIENRAEVMAIYSRLSKKYNIPYYDYSTDSLSFDKKYFYNALHMNTTGAELFTSKLIKKLKGLDPHWYR